MFHILHDPFTPNTDDPIAPTYAITIDEATADRLLALDPLRSWPLRAIFTLLDMLRALVPQGGTPLRTVDPELWRFGSRKLLGIYPDCVLVDQSFPYLGHAPRGDAPHVLFVEAFDPDSWKLRARLVATFSNAYGYQAYLMRFRRDGSVLEETGDVHEELLARLQRQIRERIELERIGGPPLRDADLAVGPAWRLAELARRHAAAYPGLPA